MDDLTFDVVVAGAGVVGLAASAALLRKNPKLTILIVERHKKFGWESSSHNSEVIHAGIYYKHLPNKQKHCLKGKELLYEHCQKNQVPYKNCGKYLMAFSKEQNTVLESIKEHATSVGVSLEDFPISKLQETLQGAENLYAALWSSSTGIVDSHQLMLSLESASLSAGAIVLYEHSLGACLQNDSPFELELLAPQGEMHRVKARYFVNCGGLGAAKFHQQLHLDSEFEIRPCRGRYYRLGTKWQNKVDSLLYPVPDPRGGLGIHLTLDMEGALRLGPDVDWPEGKEPDDFSLYRFEDGAEETLLREKFLRAGKSYLSSLAPADLQPDYVGVRSKLFKAGALHKDFHLDFRDNDFHFLGIESPGLTASLSLAEELAERF